MIDDYDDYDDAVIEFQHTHRRNIKADACEDDSERTCPFIGILPNETAFEKEELSPLSFVTHR